MQHHMHQMRRSQDLAHAEHAGRADVHPPFQNVFGWVGPAISSFHAFGGCLLASLTQH